MFKTKLIISLIPLIVVVSFGAGYLVRGVKMAPGEVQVEQTLCPVLGHKIDKSIYSEYKGERYYFCCSACIEKFDNDPEKYTRANST